MAADDEVLIEKSPQYAGGEESLRLKRARIYVCKVFNGMSAYNFFIRFLRWLQIFV